MNILQALLLFGAAAVGGAMNAVAGGGSFVSFPALLFTGVPPIIANATNAFALWPGSAASVGAYRRELAQQRRELALLSVLSVVGGLAGAMLLLYTSERVFERLIPYLLLLATAVFASSSFISRRLARASPTTDAERPMRRLGVLLVYGAVAIYGGFFGAGLGILTLATLALLGFDNIHEMNALKTLQATIIGGIAVLTFVIAGIIQWPAALVMTCGAILGGYGGAAIARQLDPRLVRWGIILIGCVLTTYYFVV